MDQTQKQKLMTQILIGSAWIDRTLAPEEKSFLQQVLERYGLGHDEEVMDLLAEPTPVADTEKRLVTYFKNSSEDERMQLLADIGKVLIADDEVTDLEHDLLDDYHALMAKIPARSSTDEPSITEEIGQAVRQVGSFVVDLLNNQRTRLH